ncbi:MAG: hypothetical protein WCF24_05615 [Acidimicrobiales bacterium]
MNRIARFALRVLVEFVAFNATVILGGFWIGGIIVEGLIALTTKRRGSAPWAPWGQPWKPFNDPCWIAIVKVWEFRNRGVAKLRSPSPPVPPPPRPISTRTSGRRLDSNRHREVTR